MTFFVEKRLSLGSIRFGSGRRHTSEAIDENPELSTGPRGEFIRRRNEGFYFGGQDRFDKPVLPETPSIRSTPFWTSLTDNRGMLTIAIVGAVIGLLGFLVLANKGAEGWVEVILGLIIIAVPVALTAQARKKIAAEEQRAHAERNETENRRREMLAGYTGALDRVQNDRTEEALQKLVNEHPDLPYNVWAPSARRVALLIGFEELAKHGVAGSADVAKIMDRVSRSAGLTPEHETGAKADLYNAIVWHLLADDRLGPVQQEQLAALRKSLGIGERDIPEDTMKAIDQFDRLRGITTANLPRTECSGHMGFKEYCVHQSQSDQGALHITNKQLIVEGKKRHTHALSSLADVTVYVDDNMVSVRDSATKKQLRLVVEDAIYTAAMVDLASSIDERPKGFS